MLFASSTLLMYIAQLEYFIFCFAVPTYDTALRAES